MRTILHISDIHFGKTEDAVIGSLTQACIRIHPDLVVISGDLTQRAHLTEFQAARDFLKDLHASHLGTLIIPGNHDIRPLYNPIKRARDAYDRYNSFIAPLSSSCFVDSEIAIWGINTVRASRLKGGHLSKKDVAEAKSWFSDLPTDIVRIVMTHHPLDLPKEFPRHRLASQAERGIYELARSHVDVYLSGHYHRSSTVCTQARYDKEHYAAIAVQAGTVSTRSRGELQSFNLLNIERTKIDITPYLWDPTKKDFLPTKSFNFVFRENRWVPAGAATESVI